MITTQIVCGQERPLYMDNGLHMQLTEKVVTSVHKKDKDWFAIVDGEEGVGKSVFAFQIAKTLDPNFSYKQVVFNANEFIKAVMTAQKNQCIVFDEAFTGLSSRTSLSEINNLLVSLMMEMRQKNLFIILVMPTFFMLDKYCVLHRAKGLFHVFSREGRRGYWHFYNKRSMKFLYLKGKKFYEYNEVKPVMFGKFQDQYMLNETEYRKTKTKALHHKERKTKAEKYMFQRNVLFYLLYKRFNKTQTELVTLCKECDFDIEQKAISDAVKDISIKQQFKEALEEKQEEVNTEKSVVPNFVPTPL